MLVYVDPTEDRINRVYTRIDAHTVHFVRSQDGKAVQTGSAVVSSDGKTYTVTTGGIGPNGQPVSSVAVFEKQQVVRTIAELFRSVPEPKLSDFPADFEHASEVGCSRAPTRAQGRGSASPSRCYWSLVAPARPASSRKAFIL
jgi:hypothetical protein